MIKSILYSFIIALVATVGSLFFSEIMEFIPCSLCWYQRIFMYPLVIIFMVGFLTESKETFKFSIPLTVIGFFLALYHNLLIWEIIPEKMSPCVEGIPCTSIYINWFGFMTIPFLSLMAFSLLLFVGLKNLRKYEK